MGVKKKRTGLRICGARGHREVRAALIRYASWLRRNYEFPIRVPVYLSPRERITTMHGLQVTASFFAPWNRKVEPYIKVATGDYSSLKKEDGRENTLAEFIASMSHELVHYWQWLETGDVWERGVERKADAMLRRYELTVDHP